MPEGGPHHVAIRQKLYEARQSEVDNFFGRPLATRRSRLQVSRHEVYEVFSFKEESEAQAFMKAFEGEPFDPRDKGRGSKWMFWFKGRVSGRKTESLQVRLRAITQNVAMFVSSPSTINGETRAGL